jgi:Domain of Unknown Function (DUF748)
MRRPIQAFRAMPRWYRWLTGVAVVVAVLVVIAALFMDEPLRRLVERQMNERLKGYTARVGRLHFNPIGFELNLYDVVLIQNANPDPPVMSIDRLSADVQWSALVHARLVADFELARPTLYINRQHLEAEKKDATPVTEHGWQDALQAIYPLKINEFTIRDGDVTYVEAGQAQPLRIRDFQAVAHDIRNVRSEPGDYPSPLIVRAVVFDRGRLMIDGRADFLAEPYAGVKGRVEMTDIALDYFRPVLERSNVLLTSGTVSGRGLIEYAPKFKKVDLEELRVDGLHAEYIYEKRKAAVAKQTVKATAETAKDVSNAPDVVLRARQVTLNDATVGLINKQADPQYRVFIANTNLIVENFSNQKSEGYGHARLKGRFLDSGDTVADMVMRAETHGPDFTLNLKIENTDMRAMNDLLRAHTKGVDVTSGVFSLYTEIAVKNGRVNGYVKPIFRDLRIYDKEQDAEKTLGQKIKEKAADIAAKVFKNHPRDEVATIANVSGPLETPRASTWEVLVNVLRNAFIKAILPGFEREARAGRG